jgi:hypothetical protein
MVASSLGPYALLPGSAWPPGPEGTAEAWAPDGGRVVLRRSTPALVAALAAAPHDHLLRPVDVLTDDDGALVVVVAGPRGERLDTWLGRRGALSAGEAVTVLLPVLAAVSHLARRGTVLGGIGLEHVELDDRGAPVLVGGVVAAQRTPGGVPQQDGLPEAVTEGARTFVEAVALQLSPRDRDDLLGPDGVGTSLDRLIEQVHDLARPVALPTTTTRVEGEEAEAAWRAPPEERPRSGWASVLPESALIDGLADWWEAAAAVPVVERLRSVRPRFWLLGGLVAVSLVVGGIVVPQGPSTAPEAPGGAAAEAAGGRAGASAGETAVAAPAQPQGSPPAMSATEALVRGDDAVAAAEVLLVARRDCLRDPSVSCLAAVDQAGSPAAAADSTVLEDPSATDGLVLPVRVESEVQRLGESVLLACWSADDEPASVLVVRTEAGWRLREVVRR